MKRFVNNKKSLITGKIFVNFSAAAILFFIIISAGCSEKKREEKKIFVAVAGSMSNTAELLSADYKQRYGDTEIIIITASSGKIASQIINGAPFDIFMSADLHFPEMVYEKKLSLKPEIYARGKLILFSRNGIKSFNGLSALKNHNVRYIAIANPDLAPYGKAAMEALSNSGIIIPHEKFLTAENVMQCANIALNSADFGFVSESILYSPGMVKFNDNNGNWVEVDSKLYTPLDHGVVLLKRSGMNETAKKFYDYILSDHAKKILGSNGFYTKNLNKERKQEL